MEIELIIVIAVICSTLLAGAQILKGSGRKRKTRSLVEESFDSTIDVLKNTIQVHKQDIARLNGVNGQYKKKLMEFDGIETEDNVNTQESVSIDAIKPLLKTLVPQINDSQIALAMEIPQVKELLGSIGTEKNFALIKQLLPLLTKKKDESQVSTENQELWA